MIRDLRDRMTDRRKFLRDVAAAGGLVAVASSTGAAAVAHTAGTGGAGEQALRLSRDRPRFEVLRQGTDLTGTPSRTVQARPHHCNRETQR